YPNPSTSNHFHRHNAAVPHYTSNLTSIVCDSSNNTCNGSSMTSKTFRVIVRQIVQRVVVSITCVNARNHPASISWIHIEVIVIYSSIEDSNDHIISPSVDIPCLLRPNVSIGKNR